MVEKIENYSKPTTVNPWIAELDGFVVGDAFAEVITPSERKVRDENGNETGEVKRSIAGTKARIQDAARALGMTARVAEEVPQEDGTVRVVFTLGEAQKSGPRKPADEGTGEDAAPKRGRKGE